jgi:hypothetical protein
MLQHNTCNIFHSHNPQTWNLTFFFNRIIHTPKVEFLCEIYNPKESSSHTLKDSPLWDHPPKTIRFYNGINNNLWIYVYFLKTSFSHMVCLQALITTSNTKLLNANFNSKATIITFYIFKGIKWMGLITFIYIYSPFIILLCQTNRHISLFWTFHPFINSYIIWNAKFGQVYILKLPLLLAQNSYLNYS